MLTGLGLKAWARFIELCCCCYHFCLALSARFTQPGYHLLAEPSISISLDFLTEWVR